MNELHALHFRERCAERQRQASRLQLASQVAASRRWRRRAEQARRSAESYERRAEQSVRGDYELAGR